MNAIFEADKHYNSKSRMGEAEFCHTHWFIADEGKMVSLFSVDLRAYSEAGERRSFNASIDAWDVSPAELHQLAAAMSRAADNLEAHMAQQKKKGVV